MEAKSFIQLFQDGERDAPNPLPRSLHRDRAHLLRLRLGVVAEAPGRGRREHLEQIHPVDARGRRYHGHRAPTQPQLRGIGAVVAHDSDRTAFAPGPPGPGRCGAPRRQPRALGSEPGAPTGGIELTPGCPPAARRAASASPSSKIAFTSPHDDGAWTGSAAERLRDMRATGGLGAEQGERHDADAIPAAVGDRSGVDDQGVE